MEGLNVSVLMPWLKAQKSQYFLSGVSLAELEPFQGFLTEVSLPSAAAWLKVRPKPWLKWPLQLTRYQGLLLSHFVPAQQGALCSVLSIFAVGLWSVFPLRWGDG